VTRYNILLYTLKEWDMYIEKVFANGLRERLACSGQEDLFSEYFISFFETNSKAERRLVKVLNTLDIASLHVDINRYSPSVMIAGLVYVALSLFIGRSGYALFGYDSLSSPTCDFVFQESTNALILNFLSSALNLASIDLITTPVSFFSEFLMAPELEQTLSEHVLLQPYNKSSLTWLHSNNLRLV